MLRHHFWFSSPVLLMLLSIVGCGDSTGPKLGHVEGVITIDDEPASLVMVEFQPLEQGHSPSYGFADIKGHYKLKYSSKRNGAVVGAHTIRVTYGDDPSPDDESPKVVIPARFNRLSELKAEVKPGNNRHNLDLKLGNTTTRTASK